MTSFTETLPSTLSGMRSLAKRLTRAGEGSFTQQLDRVAALAGFSNWRDARRRLAANGSNGTSTTPSPIGRLVTISCVAQSRDREWRRIAAQCGLTAPLSTLAGKALFRRGRALAGMRIVDETCIEARYSFEGGDIYAGQEIWKAAATLRFIERTGLRRATSRERDSIPSALRDAPNRDHITWWTHPATGVVIELREPYEEALVQDFGPVAKQGFSSAISKPGTGVYSARTVPVFMAAPGHELLLEQLARAIDAPPFVVMLRPVPAVIDGIPKPKPLPPIGDNEVRMKSLLGRSTTRPRGRMPLASHQSVGDSLQWMQQFAYTRTIENLLNAARGDLEDWVQREYPSEADMPQELFVTLYYGQTHRRRRPEATETEEVFLRSADIIKQLTASYPVCGARRRVIEDVERATALICKGQG